MHKYYGVIYNTIEIAISTIQYLLFLLKVIRLKVIRFKEVGGFSSSRQYS